MRRSAPTTLVGLFLLILSFGGCEPGASEAPRLDGRTELGWYDDLRSATAALSVDHEAQLLFQADGNVMEIDSPIMAGGRLRVVYTPDRLPNCRATVNGVDAWKIVLYWRALPDQTIHEATLATAGQSRTQVLVVPEDAEELELWFLNSDVQGCEEWDSNGGANHRFDVAPPGVETVVTFGSDWQQSADGPIERGGLLRIDYAPSRLGACRATYAGGRAWNIVASWVFEPGGQTGNVALYQGNYFAGDAAIIQPEIYVPEDATSVSLWFSNSDRAGCVGWDSAYGDNYTFDVVPPDGTASPEVGWAGDWDFVVFHRDPGTHEGDRDPAYYWDHWAGSETSSWVEVQVWIPGITDQRYDSPAALRAAAERIRAEAVTDAFEGEGPDGWGLVPLDVVRQQGNNFVYQFRFFMLRYDIYHSPAIADGLHHYYVRFSTDDGASWYDAGKDGERTRRFVVAENQTCDLFPDNPPSACPQMRPVGWAGRWGGYFSHACYWREGLDNPITFAKSGLGHDCMIITADVWVPGVTDSNGDPMSILAEVETDIGFSGGPLATPATYRLAYVGRNGNDYRYKWYVSEHVARADRGDYRFRFRFSADGGQSWTTIGTGDSSAPGDWRTLLVRNDSTDTEVVEYCEDIFLWNGSMSTLPHCVDYQPDSQYDATNCEFFANAFGRGNVSHNGSWADWVEAYVSLRSIAGDVLGVGVWLSVRDNGTGATGERYAYGTEIESGYWRAGYTYERGGPGAVNPPDETIEAFAFFVDVRRHDGQVVRLWQSNGGANYSMENTFSVAGYLHGIGIGTIEYADESVTLFDQKHACQ